MADLTFTQMRGRHRESRSPGAVGIRHDHRPVESSRCRLNPMSSMILAMGICYGGAAQVIAGVQEWKKNNADERALSHRHGILDCAIADEMCGIEASRQRERASER